MDNPVIIFGAGGLGRAALEIFESNGNVVYGFLDDNKDLHGQELDNVAILGSTTDDGFLKLIGEKCEAFIATDENKLKKSLAKTLNDRRKVMPVNAIHESAAIARSASIGHGNFVNARTAIGAGTTVGHHCLLQIGALIQYDCTIGDFVQVGAGSIVNASVTIEEGVFIGTGAVIVSGVTIGKNARIGAGSVVVGDVQAGTTMFGNPALEVKK